MRVIILGSAAGGGLPQWNCGCPNCRAAREQGPGRTQSSVAVSADGERWILLNASPDLRQQLAAHRALWPRGVRGTPLAAVVCTDGEIDHTLGLMLLREHTTQIPVYAPGGVISLLADPWPLFRVLSAYAGADARPLPDGEPEGAPPDRRRWRQRRRAAPPGGEAHRARAHQQHESHLVPRLGRAGAGCSGGDRGGRRRHGVRAVRPASDSQPWSPDELVRRLRAMGEARYHIHHPFNQRMHRGELRREELQLWVANRFCYQQAIPIKDAAIMSNCPEPAVRRAWIQRIVDHDGRADGEGGLEAWLRLAEAMGVERDTLLAGRWVLPGVRFAVEAYITFCRTRPWIEAVAASLTELFAPTIVSQRLSAILAHYKWIDPAGLEYFRARLQQAPRDAEHALALVTERCRTRELQERAVAALDFKCDVLWSLLDAVERGPLPGNAP